MQNAIVKGFVRSFDIDKGLKIFSLPNEIEEIDKMAKYIESGEYYIELWDSDSKLNTILSYTEDVHNLNEKLLKLKDISNDEISAVIDSYNCRDINELIEIIESKKYIYVGYKKPSRLLLDSEIDQIIQIRHTEIMDMIRANPNFYIHDSDYKYFKIYDTPTGVIKRLDTQTGILEKQNIDERIKINIILKDSKNLSIREHIELPTTDKNIDKAIDNITLHDDNPYLLEKFESNCGLENITLGYDLYNTNYYVQQLSTLATANRVKEILQTHKKITDIKGIISFLE